MVQMAPPQLIVGAPRLPLPYGLFSTFTQRSGDRFESGIQWEPGTCDPVDGIGAADCVTTLGLPKNLAANNEAVALASPFTVYGHFRCSPMGYSGSAAQDLATAHLIDREEARVERALWTGDLGNVPNLAGANGYPEPTVLSSGSGVDSVHGLGLLEKFLGDTYGSVGVIHMTRRLATVLLAKTALESVGGRLLTKLGTPVAAGAGYPGSSPTGAAPGPTDSWAYASPALFGYRSDVFTSSNRPGDLLNRSNNDLFAVAERTYLLGFDPCGVGAAQLQD